MNTKQREKQSRTNKHSCFTADTSRVLPTFTSSIDHRPKDPRRKALNTYKRYAGVKPPLDDFANHPTNHDNHLNRCWVSESVDHIADQKSGHNAKPAVGRLLVLSSVASGVIDHEVRK